MSDFSPILVLQIKICIKPDRHGKGSNFSTWVVTYQKVDSLAKIHRFIAIATEIAYSNILHLIYPIWLLCAKIWFFWQIAKLLSWIYQLCAIEVQINFPYITFSNSSFFLIKHHIQYWYIRNHYDPKKSAYNETKYKLDNSPISHFILTSQLPSFSAISRFLSTRDW